MGEWLSGEKLEDKQNLKDFHKTLSKALGKFAAFAKDYLSDPFGRAVYAGGDDFLGFVNLNHIFDVLITLRKDFYRKVSLPLKQKFKKQNDEITFSAGIAIAHYKVPLSIVLESARSMEKKAKNVNGKDALGFALLKHSGNISETVFKWNYKSEDTGEIKTINLAQDISNALKTWISDKFLYSLRDEFLHLVDDKERIKPYIFNAELYRLMSRCEIKFNISEETIKEERKILTDKLSNLFAQLRSQTKPLTNFFSFLELCNFIARETNHDTH